MMFGAGNIVSKEWSRTNNGPPLLAFDGSLKFGYGEGDLFIDEVFFFESSLFRTHFFLELDLWLLFVDCYMVHCPSFASFA